LSLLEAEGLFVGFSTAHHPPQDPAVHAQSASSLAGWLPATARLDLQRACRHVADRMPPSTDPAIGPPRCFRMHHRGQTRTAVDPRAGGRMRAEHGLSPAAGVRAGVTSP
jgi:hypothetical protein